MASGIVTLPGEFVSGVVRASYVHIWEPQKVKDFKTNAETGDTEYVLTLICEPDDSWVANELIPQLKAAKNLAWPDADAKGIYVRSPIRQGVQKSGEAPLGFNLVQNPEYKGKQIIRVASKNKPVQVFDCYNRPLTDKSKLYSGCYVRVVYTVYAYPPKNGGDAGVNIGLAGVMVWEDGEPLMRSVDAAAVLSAVAKNPGDNPALLGGAAAPTKPGGGADLSKI